MHFLKTNCLFTQTKGKMKMWNDVLMTQKIVLLIIWFGTYLIDRIHILQFSRSSTLYGKTNAYYHIGFDSFLTYIWIMDLYFRSTLTFYDLLIILHHSHILFNERIKEKFFITCVFLKTTKGSICITISVCNTLCKHRWDERRNVFSLVLTITNYNL